MHHDQTTVFYYVIRYITIHYKVFISKLAIQSVPNNPKTKHLETI